MLFKYILRYAPLLLLALLLIPVKSYFAHRSASVVAQPQNSSMMFSEVSEQTLYDLALPSAQEGWAVGAAFVRRVDSDGHVLQITSEQGLIWHYTAGNWTAFATTTQPLLSISMVQENDGWAVGYGGTLFHYDGHAWTGVSSPTREILRAVVMLSSDNVWAVGFGGTILHYDGANWSRVASPTPADLRSIAMSGIDAGWIVGAAGILLHYQNGAWVQASSPTSAQLNRVTMLSADEGWAVGTAGTILHYHSGSWYSVAIPDSTDLNTSAPVFYALAMTAVDSGWLIGGGSMLYYAHELWQPIQSYALSNLDVDPQQDFALYSLSMISAHEGWAVGEVNNEILLLHYQAGTWYEYS